jgi:catechol 2,3-dioxygenase-like lactoylglutathione lyase family enzyme
MTGECKQSPNSVGLTVTDMQKSLAFYRDKLGFQLSECWPGEKDAMWASLLLDGQSVMFGQSAPPERIGEMCKGNPAAVKFWTRQARAYAEHPKGVGVNIYLKVADIDAYAARIQKNGVALELPPTSQFYGLRDIVVTDPDGYVLTFYTPIQMSSCQSCGKPLADTKPGDMYCEYCTDESGRLRPYEQVLEGTTTGYFMAMQKMPRKDAEKAAVAHLAAMPAWKNRT